MEGSRLHGRRSNREDTAAAHVAAADDCNGDWMPLSLLLSVSRGLSVILGCFHQQRQSKIFRKKQHEIGDDAES